MTWGPFLPVLEAGERKARLRSLRIALRLLCGPRGRDAELAVLRAEISGGDEVLIEEAAAAFERLGSIDRRRVLASFAAVLLPH